MTAGRKFQMRDVFVCDAVRTPIGRFGGSLAKVRADDLAAAPIKALKERHPKLDWSAVDEVFLGCANQAGEDNRNVARMALLLAGLPDSVPGQTLNRLCASGLDAVGAAGRAIRAGEIDFAIAGGVESMTRAPFVMGKAPTAFAREKALSALGMTKGARLMLSTPPAIMSDASPALIARAAVPSASSPDPQRRLTVEPGTSSGRPASNALMRATLRLSSPAWLAQP